MSDFEAVIAILGLAVLTLVSRGFFLLPEREITMPEPARRALRYAPLAALVAICVPEVILTQGELTTTLKDARLLAALAAGAWFFWRRGILGTILSGMAVYLPLHLALGW